MARYPFAQEAAEYVKALNLKIDDLINPEYGLILRRAEERIAESLLYSLVSEKSYNEEIEILSFPVAVMMVAATADSFIKKRYALAESKRVYNLLKADNERKIIEISKNFNWKIKPVKGLIESQNYDFTLYFTDYLNNAIIFKEKKWKLVNRVLSKGKVSLTKFEASRLLAEEVRKHIETKLGIKIGPLPEKLTDRLSKLKQLFIKHRGEIRIEKFPKAIVFSAFPPCIDELYKTTASAHHISHVARFTLTSFLITIGMSVEEVVNLFHSLSDFNKRMTRYQVEHIAGERGSRTSYTPPSCDTLHTYGICNRTNGACGKISHPLAYYRKKIKLQNFATNS